MWIGKTDLAKKIYDACGNQVWEKLKLEAMDFPLFLDVRRQTNFDADLTLPIFQEIGIGSHLR